MNKNTKTLLKEIAEKGATTEEQRNFIRNKSKELGVKFIERRACNSCFKDQAVILWRILAEQEIPDTRKYVLKSGTDVIWRGQRVNNTMTDKQLKELLKEGFPSVFFAKMGK